VFEGFSVTGYESFLAVEFPKGITWGVVQSVFKVSGFQAMGEGFEDRRLRCSDNVKSMDLSLFSGYSAAAFRDDYGDDDKFTWFIGFVGGQFDTVCTVRADVNQDGETEFHCGKDCRPAGHEVVFADHRDGDRLRNIFLGPNRSNPRGRLIMRCRRSLKEFSKTVV
jgi:hypothetical protein